MRADSSRVEPAGGASLEEIALGEHRRPIESRLNAAILPADDEGEQPLLPALDDMAGIGTTDDTPFLAVKPSQPTPRSHVSQPVCDSGWERTVARALDESPRVLAWAKNHWLGFEVPYLHSGVAHSLIPDCLVDVAAPGRGDGVEHLVVEVKDLEREQDRSKDVGAARWIAAVNHWDRLGRWRYSKLNAPHDLVRVLEVSAEA